MRPPLSLVVLFVLTVGAPAAPLPQNRPVTDKYLLDDTDFLVVVNLRQIIASPAYKSELEKVVEGALRAEPLAATLKELSLDPAKDIDQVCMVMGRSCWPMNKGPAGPPLMVLVSLLTIPAMNSRCLLC